MNNTRVRTETIKKIAKSKGLAFSFDEAHNLYVMRDSITNECLMTYATVTVNSITSERVWREECNKLKSQSYR